MEMSASVETVDDQVIEALSSSELISEDVSDDVVGDVEVVSEDTSTSDEVFSDRVDGGDVVMKNADEDSLSDCGIVEGVDEKDTVGDDQIGFVSVNLLDEHSYSEIVEKSNSGDDDVLENVQDSSVLESSSELVKEKIQGNNASSDTEPDTVSSDDEIDEKTSEDQLTKSSVLTDVLEVSDKVNVNTEIHDTTQNLTEDLPNESVIGEIIHDNKINTEDLNDTKAAIEDSVESRTEDRADEISDIEIDYVQDFYDNFFGITTLPPGLMTTGLDSYMILQKNILKNCSMPWLVKRCCEVIIERGLHTVGIFRVPGGHAETEEILDAFNMGEVPDISHQDVESVSSALKKYLRNLPRPLLSDDTIEEGIQKRVVELWDLEDDQEKIKLLKGVISDLSPFRKVTLKEFFYLLYRISLEHEVNMMHSYNIATIFGGMVDIVSNMLPSGRKTDFCDFLISNFPAIFGERDFLKPCYNFDSSGKSKGVYVYLQDGTYSSKISKHDEKAGDTLKYIIGKQYLVKPYILSPSSYLYELQDSTWRRIELDEYIVPISERGSTILLSHLIDTTLDNRLDLSHYIIHEPTVYIKSTPEITEVVIAPEKTEKKPTSARDETSERPKSDRRKARFQNNRRTSLADFLTKKKKKRRQYDDSEQGIIDEFNEKEDGMIAKLTVILKFLNPLIEDSPVANDNDVILYRDIIKKAIRFHATTKENVSLTGISEGYTHNFDTMLVYPKYGVAKKKFMEIIFAYKDVDFISSVWSDTYEELMESPSSHFSDLVKIFEHNQNLSQEMEERIEYQKCIEFTNTLINNELNDSVEANQEITTVMESFTDLPFSISIEGRKLVREGSVNAHVLDSKIQLAVYLFNDAILIGKKKKKERVDLEFYNFSILKHLRVETDEDLILIYQLENPIPILVFGYSDKKILESWKTDLTKTIEISKAMSRGQTKRVRNLGKFKKTGTEGLRIKTATSRKRKSSRRKSARKSSTSPRLSDMPFDNQVLWEFFMNDPENGVQKKLKKRKHVWSGKDAVLWLVEHEYASSNTEATDLLSDHFTQKGFFSENQTEFLMSKNAHYYFYELEARKLPTMSALLPESTSKLGISICGHSESKDYQELLDFCSQQSNLVLEINEKKTAEEYYQWLYANRKDFKSKSKVSYFHTSSPFIYTTRSKKYLGTKDKFLESYNFHMETS